MGVLSQIKHLTLNHKSQGLVGFKVWSSLMKTGSKLWPLECQQGFSLIWPTDLVFDPTWPRFELGLKIIEMNILTKSDEDWVKTVTARVLTRFFFDLTYWPSFWPHVTQIRTWPRDHLRWTFSLRLIKIWSKLWQLECQQGFSLI